MIRAGAICLLLAAYDSRVDASERWAREIGIDSMNVRGVATSCAGGLVAVGNSNDGATLMRFDPSGNLLWHTQLYDYTWFFSDVIALKPAGYAAVGAFGPNAWFSWFDEGGHETRHVEIQGWPNFRPACAAADGGFYAAATGSRPGVGLEIWVVRFDAGGVLRWTRMIGGSLDEVAGGIAETPDGGLFVAGRTNSSGAGGSDLLLVRLDPDGNLGWARTYGGAGSELGGAVIAMADGGATLLGNTASFGAGGVDDWVLRVGPSGDVAWQEAIGGPRDDRGIRGVGFADGGSAILGTTTSFGASTGTGGDDLFVVRLAADGTVSWSRAYGDAGQQQTGGIAADSAGGIFVAGYTPGMVLDGVLLRVGSSGEIALNCGYDHAAGPTMTPTGVLAVPAPITFAPGDPFLLPGPQFPVTVTVTNSAICAAGPPGEVSPAGSTLPLRFLDHATLAWEDANRNGAATFNLYRGSIEGLVSGDTGSCLMASIAATSIADPANPSSGDGWFYLVTGENAEGEGSRGNGAGCAPRAPVNSCSP
jgi:hypothetical protein